MLRTLIEQEGGGVQQRILIAAALSGAANTAVLAIINAAAAQPERPSLALLGMLIVAALLFALSLRICVGTMSSLLEAILRKLRIRIADKIRRAELLQLEGVGTSEIIERLTQQTSEISSASWPIAVSVQSLVMLVFSVVYLVYASPTALVLSVTIYGGAAVFYYYRNESAKALMQETAKTRMRLLDVLSDLLRGFKEVRFRTARGDALHADFVAHAESLEQGTTQTNFLQQSNYVFIYLCQFALLGAVVFVLPQFTVTDSQSVQKITAALLFMFGPLGGVLYGLPAYNRADLACKNIVGLEQRLDAIAPLQSGTAAIPAPFAELEAVDLEFQRQDESGRTVFAVGPINLTVRAGEIVFLVGGNGSGKTTLLRTMTGLYAPTAGTLRVNGVPITAHNVQTYREMIAAIFTDFHLFKKLYGLAGAKADQVQQLLGQMAIGGKTSLSAGTFSTVDLSTGQRKRVAMVVALLEDRPIYIFDEWAADQDPEFRHYFYAELLPELKRQGKAIIAISHDDRYFHCADRVVTLEYGKVRSVEQHELPVAAHPPQPRVVLS